MEQEEFDSAFDLGVDTNGRGIRDPGLFGCDTVHEAREELADTYSTPLRNETHVYRVSGGDMSRLVGINATSKQHADTIIERDCPLAVRCDEYLGELNDLLSPQLDN